MNIFEITQSEISTTEPKDFDSALADFTEAVQEYLQKRAERTYRRPGEPWDSRINQLSDQYVESLKMENLRNWVRYSYEPRPGMRTRTPLFFVLKSDSGSHDAGDVFMANSQGRPDTRYVQANIFNANSVDILASGF